MVSDSVAPARVCGQMLLFVVTETVSGTYRFYRSAFFLYLSADLTLCIVSTCCTLQLTFLMVGVGVITVLLRIMKITQSSYIMGWLCCSFIQKQNMHVNRFFIKGNSYTSPHNVFVLVYIITHHQCLLLASLISRFTFYEDCLGVEQQMQTLNSNSYKADIISGNIEADREAIEMQIDCWGCGSREKKLARMTMQVNHSSLSRRPRFVTKLGMDFSTSAATALKRIIFKNSRKGEIK